MKKIYLVVCLILMAMVAGKINAEPIDIIKGVMDIPATWNIATLYSAKYAEMNIGSGIDVLAIHTPAISQLKIPALTWNEALILYSSQNRTAVGLAIGIPIAMFEDTGILTTLLPGLKNVDGGLYGGWNYTLATSDNGIAFGWGGFDFGVSCIKKF